MAKTKISEYDATAANNTDINSINIAEGCAPSGINNAIRETMAALKRFQTGADGDPLTVGSNLVVTGNATLGDASGDSVTINAATVSTPNGLNFDSNTFVIDATNNRVGIGKSSPTVALDVSGVASANNIRAITTFQLVDSLGSERNILELVSDDLRIQTGTTAGARSITFLTENTERLRIDSSGNVGIGTSSPSEKLTLGAAGKIQVLRSDNARGGEFFADNTGTHLTALASGSDPLFIESLGASGQIRFTTGGTERMRIDSSGNLLVGTTTTLSSSRAAFYSSTAVPAAEFRVNAGSSDATQAIGIIKNSTTNTTAQVLMNFAINNGGTGAGQINCNGASAAAFGTFSDSRLKQNIVDLPPQLANILAIRPVEFDYIESEGGGHQIGFIAQEFEQVYSDAVGERADGMKTLTGWSKTEARLVKAIQELKAENDALKSRLDAAGL